MVLHFCTCCSYYYTTDDLARHFIITPFDPVRFPIGIEHLRRRQVGMIYDGPDVVPISVHTYQYAVAKQEQKTPSEHQIRKKWLPLLFTPKECKAVRAHLRQTLQRKPTEHAVELELLVQYPMRVEASIAAKQAAVTALLAEYRSTETIALKAYNLSRSAMMFRRQDCVYAGRPAYRFFSHIPEMARGSYLANPYPVGTTYTLEQSLAWFEIYLKARIRATSLVELRDMVQEWPTDLAAYIDVRIGRQTTRRIPVKYDYLELDIVHDVFIERLRGLCGSNLGCFCSPLDRCHVDIILHVIDDKEIFKNQI